MPHAASAAQTWSASGCSMRRRGRPYSESDDSTRTSEALHLVGRASRLFCEWCTTDHRKRTYLHAPGLRFTLVRGTGLLGNYTLNNIHSVGLTRAGSRGEVRPLHEVCACALPSDEGSLPLKPRTTDLCLELRTVRVFVLLSHSYHPLSPRTLKPWDGQLPADIAQAMLRQSRVYVIACLARSHVTTWTPHLIWWH
jgi:hypothetical protein